MSCDEADYFPFIRCNECRTKLQSLLRRMFAAQISINPVCPETLSALCLRSEFRHRGYICPFGGSDRERHAFRLQRWLRGDGRKPRSYAVACLLRCFCI